MFGSTETGGIAWRHQLQDAAWTPLPDVDVSVDEDERMWVDSDFLPPEGRDPGRPMIALRCETTAALSIAGGAMMW